MNFAKQIKSKACEIGFDKVGIARAEELPEARERLKSWLANGFHAEMNWMEREPEKRANPQLLFENARSIVAVALNYYTAHDHEISAHKGKISRYAWGDDYHEVLKDKLRELLDWIKTEIPHANGKVCVDTAPMMDKAWAQRAGLGWIGKHSNLITREVGSWVFLGEILLDIELEYDLPETNDFCGNCRACLDACPTDAIIQDARTVDSNLCISYATIESRQPEVSEKVAENLSGWLYGCDICQEVCPWNRFEQPTNEPRFEARAKEVSVDLTEILRLAPDQYAARFRKSPIKRAKISGLQRNARALLDAATKNATKNANE